MRPGLRRVGLRTRITAAFAAGALLLSTLLALLTYVLARNYLLHQRESSARRQAYVNARLVQEGLRSADVDVPTLLTSLETPADSQALAFRQGRWFTTSVAVGPNDLPAPLRAEAMQGTAVTQRFRLRHGLYYAVALPIRSADATYFEVFTLSELDGTLHTLATSLLAAAAVTAAAGAVLGRWSAGRVLRPLRAVADTAREIAAGRLDARLEAAPGGELAALAASFNTMVDELSRRLERDARFASDVSHELRSPLTTLSTAVSVLERRSGRWTASSREAVALVVDELRRFERLVADLLEISRADAGVADLVLDEVRLGELVLRIVARSRQPDVPVEVDADAADWVVRVDKRRMERVLANLLDNAADHGGGAVLVRVARDGDRAQVTVDDAGPGVPPADRERVFDRFARAVSAAPGSGGSGLGLALVAEHVRVHGGRVWVTDRPGGGARFVVELPVAT